MLFCCFCHTGRPCVVVSPLIALMEDQVAALTARGIKAAMLGSAQTKQEVRFMQHAVVRAGTFLSR